MKIALYSTGHPGPTTHSYLASKFHHQFSHIATVNGFIVLLDGLQTCFSYNNARIRLQQTIIIKLGYVCFKITSTYKPGYGPNVVFTVVIEHLGCNRTEVLLVYDLLISQAASASNMARLQTGVYNQSWRSFTEFQEYIIYRNRRNKRNVGVRKTAPHL